MSTPEISTTSFWIQIMKQALAILASAFLATAAAASVTTQHPLYGKWTWTRAMNNCTEVYEYRPDNTSLVSSGEERAESRFTVSDRPDFNGFFRLTDEVTKSNGLTGCDGSPGGTPIGDTVTIHVFFHPSGDQMLICQDPTFNACFGPLRRLSK